jgi:hypothetical protein
MVKRRSERVVVADAADKKAHVIAQD